MNILHKNDIDKIGNTAIFLANNIENLSKTKFLKLIYLLDEFSIERYGIPFFNLDYEVWKYGPVNQDIYADLTYTEQPEMLGDYIELIGRDGNIFIKPKMDFSNDEFTVNEINLLTGLVESYKTSYAKDLVDLTHKAGSLWYNTANRYNLIELFNTNSKNATNVLLDFRELLSDNPEKLQIYNDFIQVNKSLSDFK